MEPETVTLTVEGMTCGGCARAVERSVQAVPGVLGAEVDLPARALRARLDPQKADRRALASAVARAGYRVAPEER